MGSFRSSSVSSHEGHHLSSSTRDSGVQSGTDNVSQKSSSSGRIFQLAVFKEGEADSVASGPPESYQSETIAEYESLSLPTKKAKKLRGRERRHKTDEIQHPSLQGVTAPLPPGSRHNMSLQDGLGHNGLSRPTSALANLSVDGYSAASRHLTTPSPNGRPPSTAFSDGSESLNSGYARTLHSPAPLPPVGGTPRYVSSMFNASASMRNLPEEYYRRSAMSKSSLHYSMPGIFNPSDLGIFGDDDEEDQSSYQPSLDGSITQNPHTQKLSIAGRSKSQGELLPKSLAHHGSPTQQQIAQSLARSLGGTAPQPLMPRDMNCSAPVGKPDPKGRPRSSSDLSKEVNSSKVSQKPPRPRSMAVPSPIPHEKPKDPTWDESALDGSSMSMTMDSTMNSTANGGKKRFHLKRWVRGKERDRRYHPAAAAAAASSDAETSTLSMKDKKKGLKNSIKDIFKKRKSDVNISTCSAEYEAEPVLESGPVSTRVMELDHSDIKSEEEEDTSWSSRKQEGNSSVILVSVKSQQEKITPPELICYEDENGDPCSAV